MATNLKISQLTPASGVNTSDYTILVDGVTAANKRATVAQIMTAAGGGTVTSISVSGANGITTSGSPVTASGTIALGLGAITPTSVAASGAVSGSNLSGSNTGDQTISLTSDVTGSGIGSFAATIAAGAVTNAKLDSMTGPTVKGRSSGSGAPSDLSMATLNGMLPNMVGDTGSGGTAGLVPAPASGDAAAKKFLTAGALWTAPDLNDLTPSQSGNTGKVLSTNGSTTSWLAVGVGSVTNVSVVTANGVSGSVANASTVPAITLALGAITPTSVNSVVVSGTSTPTLAVTGTSSISGSNTGDQTLNSLLPSQVGAAGKNLQSDGTNVSFVADAGGTVTSVAATAGTGITVSGSPITTSGTLTITNSAPDQTVALTASTGISTSGTYPNFTITNSAPDQTVAIAAGTGISVSGTYPSFTVTNSSPSSGGTVTSVAATVPSVLSISGSPITGAGTLAITYSGTALPVANGGTGVTTSTGTTNVVLSGSPTITTPVIAQINDASGNETLKLASIASAVNEVTIENAATGNAVHISATGGDASVGLHLAGKGASGYVNVQDSTDATKRIMFNASGGTTNTRTMLSSTQTVDRTLSLPDATDTLVGKATTDTLTNKTLTSPTITGGALNGTLGATTPSSVAATTGTFSSTLGVTGVATLGNGAILGTPASGTVTNLTGTASININGTVGATTAAAGSFTTVAATASGTPAAFTKNSDGIIQTLTRASVSEWRFNIANSDPFGGQAGSLAIYPGNASVDFIIGRSNGTTANLKITDANGNAAFAGTGTFTGGINSTAIGATTPSTGAFTTVSATGASTFTNSAPSVIGGLSFRNRIINGDMRIDQRNEGASVTANSSFPVDRWTMPYNVTSLVLTAQRSTTAPTGFLNSTLITASTGASAGVSETVLIRQNCEGQNTPDFLFGTANAKTITVSFWVRSSLTGTYCATIKNSAQDRAYVAEYTINAANTFEYKTITVAGDTSGTWLNTNGIGVRVEFDLGSGTNFNATVNTWTGSNVRRTTNQVNWCGTSSRTFYLTGVQLEVGNAATEFERREYGSELIMCQRYFEKSASESRAILAVNESSAVIITSATSIANGAYYARIPFAVRKRTVPTVVCYPYSSPTNTGRLSNDTGGDYGAGSATSGAAQAFAACFTIYNGSGGTLTVGSQQLILGGWYASAEL